MILVKYPTQKEAVAAAQSTPAELGMRFCADTSGGKRLIWPPRIPGHMPEIIDTPPPEDDPAVLPETIELTTDLVAAGEAEIESDARVSDGGTKIEAEADVSSRFDAFDDEVVDDIDPGDAVDDEG